MAGEAPLLGQPAELLDQPRLADAGLAAHVDERPGPTLEAGVDQPPELAELGPPADERMRRGGKDWEQAVDAPHPYRPVETLDRHLAQRHGVEPLRQRAAHGLRGELAPGSARSVSRAARLTVSPVTV